MDPLTINWITLLKVYGYPTVVGIFLAIALVRVYMNAQKDKAECAKDLRQLRSYTDKSIERIIRMQNQEREGHIAIMTALTHDLTAAVVDLKEGITLAMNQEKESQREILAKFDAVIARRAAPHA